MGGEALRKMVPCASSQLRIGQVETEIDDVPQGEDEPILIPNELENGDLTCLGDSNGNL